MACHTANVKTLQQCPPTIRQRCPLARPVKLGDGQYQSLIIKRIIVRSGEALFSQGDRFKGLYAIKAGSLKNTLRTQQRQESVVDFLFAGELLGIGGLINGRHQTTAIALEDAFICRLSRSQFKRVNKNNPGWSDKLIVNSLSQARFQMRSVWASPVEARVAWFIQHLGARICSTDKPVVEFRLSMTRQDIAQYLNTSLESVSRSLASLRDARIIGVLRRDIQILDPERLGVCIHYNSAPLVAVAS